MPYTFGAGTGDDINFSVNTTIGATTRMAVVTGWWLPTTLTAGRGLWSVGDTIGAEIGTTTSELLLRTDNTTDGQSTTTGVGLAVNTWKFLAFYLGTNNTGPVSIWRVWAGDIWTPPTAVTVTQTVAPVGNHTGASTFYIGNKGVGTVAFQGDIADVSVGVSSFSGTSSFFQVSASTGLLGSEEADILRNYVMPHYMGNPWRALQSHQPEAADYRYFAGDSPLVQRLSYSGTVITHAIEATVNGATLSQNGSPRPLRSGIFNAQALR